MLQVDVGRKSREQRVKSACRVIYGRDLNSSGVN